MKSKYAVTFEFMTRLPITIRGEVEAGAPQTLASRAVKEAKVKAKDKEHIEKYGTIIGWSSLCILLDRYDYIKEQSPNVTTDGTTDGTTLQKKV